MPLAVPWCVTVMTEPAVLAVMGAIASRAIC
ncbi:hypothetical protein SAMN05428965_1086 [Geodermatophilus sp. DSM 45219]|nr:hypothetical protein SAMN05428965_1086 [Geodermatophilus sp. DSM 45219]